MGFFKALIVACLSFVCLTTGAFASGCANDGVNAKKAEKLRAVVIPRLQKRRLKVHVVIQGGKSSCGHTKAAKKKAKSSCGGCGSSSHGHSHGNVDIAHITPGMKRMENLRKQLAEEMGYVYNPSAIGRDCWKLQSMRITITIILQTKTVVRSAVEVMLPIPAVENAAESKTTCTNG